MQLWHGPIKTFVREAACHTLVPTMLKNFYTFHGHQASEAEVASWENSLAALGKVAEQVQSQDIGVVLEYHLPFSSQRIDAVFLGQSISAVPQGLVVELKQWSKVAVEDQFALNVLVGEQEYVHPSQQALDYAGSLVNIHSSFVEGRLQALSCSYCHNLAPEDAGPLQSGQFTALLARSPLFKKSDENKLAEHLANQVGGGSGNALMVDYMTGRFRPSKKLLEVIERTICENEEWFLLGRQREAYNAILASVCRLHKKRGKAVIIVRGGPGTGKTVIAIQLLADALRMGFSELV